MLYINRQKLKTVLCYVMLAGCLAGCLPGPGSPTSRPVRKKMLNDAVTGGNFEGVSLTSPGTGRTENGVQGMPALPFVLTDSIIRLGTENADFFVLRVPSTQFDFLLPMAQVYEPYLAGWLNAWPTLGRKGMAIDLSEGGRPTQRANFELSYASQQLSFPLVIFSDGGSAGRVELLTKFMGSLKSIRCEELNK
jgi:hypothetical protein